MLVGGLMGAGSVGGMAGYFLVPHVTSRIDRFLDPSSGDTFQVSTAINAFMQGGLFGRGPGEATVKRILPDAHTDYIFAVVGEEFGMIACLLLAGLFGFIVLRGLARAEITCRTGSLNGPPDRHQALLHGRVRR